MQVSLASWSHCRASPSIFTAKRSKSSCALNSASAASARINASTSARLRPGAVAAVAAFALDAFDAGAVEAFGRRTSKALASRGRCSFRSWSRWSCWSHWSSSSRSQRSLWSSSRGCSGVMQLVACLAALKRLSTSKRPCRSECVEKLEKVAGNSWQPNGWKSGELIANSTALELHSKYLYWQIHHIYQPPSNYGRVQINPSSISTCSLLWPTSCLAPHQFSESEMCVGHWAAWQALCDSMHVAMVFAALSTLHRYKVCFNSSLGISRLSAAPSPKDFNHGLRTREHPCTRAETGLWMGACLVS